MPDTHVLTERPTQDQVATYDAIVIGAGISGMFMLYRLRELGMTARVFEAGTNVGGTWYWNRYPGARFDSESWTYGYSFSKELMQEWDWKEHFSPQPDTLEYLNHVADKFDLRRDIQFRSTVAAAHWDDVANQWTVPLESGQQAKPRFLCTAVGILSAHTLPAIPGRDRENASHTEILTFPLLQLTKQAVLMHHRCGVLARQQLVPNGHGSAGHRASV
jgi:cation diffusion facilitator CzcD-associated flavoprotein CzcO